MESIRKVIHENGGEEMMANLIMSEAPEFFHLGDECGKAERWLRERGIYSSADILPRRFSHFTISEVELIIQNYEVMTVEKLAKLLCVPVESVGWKISKLKSTGILPSHTWEVWTEEELDYLRKNAAKKGNRELANGLGRTAGAVANRKRRIGLVLDSDIREKLQKEWRRIQ